MSKPEPKSKPPTAQSFSETADLIKDIAYLNKATAKEIKNANDLLSRHAGQRAKQSPEFVSILTDASQLLGVVHAKTAMIERALQSVLPGYEISEIDSQRAISPGYDIIQADEFFGVANLLPLQHSPEGLKYRWSGAEPECS